MAVIDLICVVEFAEMLPTHAVHMLFMAWTHVHVGGMPGRLMVKVALAEHRAAASFDDAGVHRGLTGRPPEKKTPEHAQAKASRGRISMRASRRGASQRRDESPRPS